MNTGYIFKTIIETKVTNKLSYSYFSLCCGGQIKFYLFQLPLQFHRHLLCKGSLRIQWNLRSRCCRLGYWVAPLYGGSWYSPTPCCISHALPSRSVWCWSCRVCNRCCPCPRQTPRNTNRVTTGHRRQRRCCWYRFYFWLVDAKAKHHAAKAR